MLRIYAPPGTRMGPYVCPGRDVEELLEFVAVAGVCIEVAEYESRCLRLLEILLVTGFEASVRACSFHRVLVAT